MIKTMVIDRLNFLKMQVEFKLEPLLAEQQFKKEESIEDYTLRNKIKRLNSKIEDFNMLIETINNYNYIINIPSEIKSLLSPYETFCDRINFYYNPDILSQYSEDQQIQIFMCEVFNSLQEYFMDQNADNTSDTKRGISLLYMSHLGIIEEFVPYAQSKRKQLMEYFNNKYPQSQVISFGPNDKAAKYLFNQFLTNKNSKLGQILSGKIRDNKFSGEVQYYYYFVTEYAGLSFYGNLTSNFNKRILKNKKVAI